ncbi:hypothetical protein Aab01nite_64540 [Paractinoplanes abujensis]|uniref:Lipoprotein n=1 Tax=Paractinoplanes abujensis TaxID=882441 RepID=A0A7W7G1Y6_9ACTN|nr:hypothetical protein [Actinoplanes abujensis]MBB4692635.1 hypothetical protein [Actinoplanes abujensis]GID22864.1 hypothetical protein Aab01nite_64540 [Actinoplanes abujensis]
MSHRTLLSCLAAVTLLAAGCSGEGTGQAPGVATLQSAAPVAPSAVAAQRPVFPFDASDDDRRAMAKPWEDCLVRKGGAKFKGHAEVLIVKGDVYTEDAREKAVYRACEPQQPETYEDHQRRTDLTTFKDNQREWYKCAQDAGYKLTAPDPETGEFGLTEVGPNGDAASPKIQECRRKAFAG